MTILFKFSRQFHKQAIPTDVCAVWKYSDMINTNRIILIKYIEKTHRYIVEMGITSVKVYSITDTTL